MRYIALVLLLSVAGKAHAQAPPGWLDRPLRNWNSAGTMVPAAPPPVEPLKAVISRCRLTPPGGNAARALNARGWIPYQYFGKPLAQGDVQIVGGMTGADGMCRPRGYNVFVFVGGRFAGTLSPAPMTSRLDGASGDVRLALPQIDVEFARYVDTDPLCCPSSRVIVKFRIDRTRASAVVVPFDTSRSAGARH